MLELGVSARTFRLGCAPIVNLFAQTAEPILLDHAKYEYPVVPDVSRRAAMEVFSVDDVVSVNPQTQEVVRYEPFYSYRHGMRAKSSRPSGTPCGAPAGQRDDEGTDIYLSLVDLAGRPVRPNVEALTVRTTCTNRDLPSRLPFGNEAGDFELEGAAPVQPHRGAASSPPTRCARRWARTRCGG